MQYGWPWPLIVICIEVTSMYTVRLAKSANLPMFSALFVVLQVLNLVNQIWTMTSKSGSESDLRSPSALGTKFSPHVDAT